jgi:hypothetical protein
MAAVVVFLAPARAQDSDAKAVLKAMSDYLASQATIAAKFDASIEVVTPELEKIQFDSSIALQLKRPNKLRVERVGGYAAVELVFDGTTLTLRDVDGKRFAQANAAGSIDRLVDHLRDELGIGAPGADLLVSDVFAALGQDILAAKHIGQGVIGGVECEHLAFRNFDTDWQLWVKSGPEPAPCKMVITSKTVTGAPQYTLQIREWQANADIADTAFAFQAGGDAKVELKELSGLDELPPAAGGGAQ